MVCVRFAGALAAALLAASAALGAEAGAAASVSIVTAEADGRTTGWVVTAPVDGAGAAAISLAISADAPAAGEKTRVAYLGVATSALPDVLAEHLKLAKGTGLLVDYVDAKSPAGAAGLRISDVLTKLDEQLLVNTAQLTALVRMHRPKDAVAVTFIREGKEQRASVALGEIDASALGLKIDRMPVRPFAVGPAPENPAAAEQMNRAMALMNAMQGRRQAASATSSYSDGEHTLTIVTTDGDKRLLAKDKDGQVLFDGPINTPEQRKTVPAEILKKLQTMERSMRFDVRMGNGGAVANVMAFMNAGGGPIAVVGGPGGGRAADLFSGKRETWADQEHTLTLTTRGGEKYLTVTQKDDAGTVVFEGPVQTDEQRTKVPADILKKLQEWEAKRREESRGEVSLIEDGMTVTLATELGKQRVVAKDSAGKVLFDGPVDTEDERARMPDKVRAKVEKLWKSCAAIWSSGSEP